MVFAFIYLIFAFGKGLLPMRLSHLVSYFQTFCTLVHTLAYLRHFCVLLNILHTYQNFRMHLHTFAYFCNKNSWITSLSISHFFRFPHTKSRLLPGHGLKHYLHVLSFVFSLYLIKKMVFPFIYFIFAYLWKLKNICCILLHTFVQKIPKINSLLNSQFFRYLYPDSRLLPGHGLGRYLHVLSFVFSLQLNTKVVFAFIAFFLIYTKNYKIVF